MSLPKKSLLRGMAGNVNVLNVYSYCAVSLKGLFILAALLPVLHISAQPHAMPEEDSPALRIRRGDLPDADIVYTNRIAVVYEPLPLAEGEPEGDPEGQEQAHEEAQIELLQEELMPFLPAEKSANPDIYADPRLAAIQEGYEELVNTDVFELRSFADQKAALATLLNAGEGVVAAVYPVVQSHPGFDSALTQQVEISIKSEAGNFELLELLDELEVGCELDVAEEHDFSDLGLQVLVFNVPPNCQFDALEISGMASSHPAVISAAPRLEPMYNAFADGPIAGADVLSNQVPNDPLYDGPDGDESLHVNRLIINAHRAWTVTTGSPSITVAVLDSGVYWNHPDFKVGASVAEKIWTDSDCSNGEDSHGFPCGTHGYDFSDNDGDPNDEATSGHGTKSAGTIGAITNNNRGIAGIAGGNGVDSYGAKILPVRIAGRLFTESPHALVLTKQVAEGLNYLARKKSGENGDSSIRVANLSLHFWDPSPFLDAAVKRCAKANILLVSAAGNYDQFEPSFPGRYPEVISVGSLIYHGFEYSKKWQELPKPDPATVRICCDDGTCTDPRMCENFINGSLNCIPACFNQNPPTEPYACNACVHVPALNRAANRSGDYIDDRTHEVSIPAIANRTGTWMEDMQLRRAYNPTRTRNSVGAAYPSGSNHGPRLDIMAPGTMNLTTSNGATFPGRLYDIYKATSSCAPQVAGVAALMLSVNPELTREEVQALLLFSADDLNYADKTHPWYFPKPFQSWRGDGSPPCVSADSATATPETVCTLEKLSDWAANRTEAEPWNIYNPMIREAAGVGRDDYTGYGLLNAYRAVQWAQAKRLIVRNERDEWVASFMGGLPDNPAGDTGSVGVIKGSIYQGLATPSPQGPGGPRANRQLLLPQPGDWVVYERAGQQDAGLPRGYPLARLDREGNLFLQGHFREGEPLPDVELRSLEVAYQPEGASTSVPYLVIDSGGNAYLLGGGRIFEGSNPDPEASLDKYLIFEDFEEAPEGELPAAFTWNHWHEFDFAMTTGGVGEGEIESQTQMFQGIPGMITINRTAIITEDIPGNPWLTHPYLYVASGATPLPLRLDLIMPDNRRFRFWPHLVENQSAGNVWYGEVMGNGFQWSGLPDNTDAPGHLPMWQVPSSGTVSAKVEKSGLTLANSTDTFSIEVSLEIEDNMHQIRVESPVSLQSNSFSLVIYEENFGIRATIGTSYNHDAPVYPIHDSLALLLMETKKFIRLTTSVLSLRTVDFPFRWEMLRSQRASIGAAELSQLASGLAHVEGAWMDKSPPNTALPGSLKLIMGGKIKGPNHFITAFPGSSQVAPFGIHLNAPFASKRANYTMGGHFKCPQENAGFTLKLLGKDNIPTGHQVTIRHLASKLSGEEAYPNSQADRAYKIADRKRIYTEILVPGATRRFVRKNSNGFALGGGEVLIAGNGASYTGRSGDWYEFVVHLDRTQGGGGTDLQFLLHVQNAPFDIDFDYLMAETPLPEEITGIQITPEYLPVERNSIPRSAPLFIDNLFLYARDK